MYMEFKFMGRFNRFVWFIIMIIIGGGAGLYYAWYVKPAEFVDAALFNLRSDYKTDYVLMTAEIYAKDHDRLHAFMRLDKLLPSNSETRESVVEDAIKRAEGFGYNPVDLQKMYHLKEIITGERTTPTPTHDPTREYLFEQTRTAAAEIVRESSTPTPNVNGDPVADSNPFGTGVIITTDPNAAPMLELTPADDWYGYEDPADDYPGNNTSSEDQVGFSGIPEGFLGDN